jgi:ubiquitin C-terminal hydrolase
MRNYIKNNNPNFKHSCKYELKALIKHQGNAYGGHKIAVCRDYVNNNKWYEYSDGDVNEIRNKNEIFTNEAFLLFYQRINNDCYEFSGKKNFLSKSVLNY